MTAGRDLELGLARDPLSTGQSLSPTSAREPGRAVQLVPGREVMVWWAGSPTWRQSRAISLKKWHFRGVQETRLSLSPGSTQPRWESSLSHPSSQGLSGLGACR